MHSIVKASAMALIATLAVPSVPRDAVQTAGAGAPSAASNPPAVRADAAGATQPAPPVQEVVGALAPAAPAVRAAKPGAGQPAAPAEAPAEARPAAAGGMEVRRGDRLKIGFFETVELDGGAEAGRGADAEGALRTFYQRADLSGEYTVEGDGALSIPLLGAFRAAGRDIDEVRADLAASFQAVIGRSARVDARIVERAPVYVVGAVRTQGAVRFASGLFVLQAVALAGGLDRGDDSRSVRIEAEREVERLRLATLQLDRLAARRARLEAQGRGAAPSAEGVAIRAVLVADDGSSTGRPGPVAAPEPASFAATEGAILQGEQARRRERERDLAGRVTAARAEVEAIRIKLDQFEIEKAMRAERLEVMQKLRDRGVDTSDHILTLRTELADIEARRQDGRVTLVDAEARLAQAVEGSKREALDYATDLAKEIAVVDKDIAEAREAARSAATVASMLDRFSGAEAEQRYEIVRQGPDGAMRLAATDTSPLAPGDVLEVK